MTDVLARLANLPVAGNAFSDYDVMQAHYAVAERAVLANDPDLAFSVLDQMGQKVMGLSPMTWDEFVAIWREWVWNFHEANVAYRAVFPEFAS